MSKAINELLEAVDHLSLDEQESLIDVMRHRIPEHRHQEIFAFVSSAREEYRQGKLLPETPQDIMSAILL